MQGALLPVQAATAMIGPPAPIVQNAAAPGGGSTRAMATIRIPF